MPDLNILITGGLGYLGGRIADYLKRHHPESTIVLGTSRRIAKVPDWAKPFQNCSTEHPQPGFDQKSSSKWYSCHYSSGFYERTRLFQQY